MNEPSPLSTRAAFAPPDATPARHSWLERALGVVTEVKPGEGPTALLLMFNVFLVLTAYYVIKPVREALIGIVPGGPEKKSYMGAAIAVALFFAVPIYARVAAKVPRNVLITRVSIFFVANLVGFWLLGISPWVASGTGSVLFAMGFLLWVGVFNMMIVAQFWAFAADIYRDEQGTRLFPLIGIGASIGSVVGSFVVNRLVEKVGTEQMLLVSGALLLSGTFVTQAVHRREARRPRLDAAPASVPTHGDRRDGAYALVLRNRYLLLIAIFTVIFSLVNTSGEFMLSQLVSDAAKAVTPVKEEQKSWIAAYYGDFFFYVNLAGVVVQTFLVSRVMKVGGLKVSFLIFPIVALASASLITLLPVLAFVRIGKTAENALDYSLNNTVRNSLWLPTSRRMKYVAKQAIDSFFARVGDVGSAGIVFVTVHLMQQGVRAVAVVNAVLVLVWIYVAFGIVRENRKLTEARAAEELAHDHAEHPL